MKINIPVYENSFGLTDFLKRPANLNMGITSGQTPKNMFFPNLLLQIN